MLLPTEIWLEIATFLRRKFLISLILVCRHFHRIFIRALYINISIKLPDLNSPSNINDSELGDFAFMGRPAALLFTRLEADSTLKTFVRNIEITNLSQKSRALLLSSPESATNGVGKRDSSEDRLDDNAFGALMRALVSLSCLESVLLIEAQIHFKWLVFLASRSTPGLKLSLKRSELYGELGDRFVLPDDEATEVIKVSSLSLISQITLKDASSVLAHFLLSPFVRRLDLGGLHPRALRKAFQSLNKLSLPHLEELKIQSLLRNDIAMLRAMPNLRKFSIKSCTGAIWDLLMEDLPSGHGPSGILKRLETITVHQPWIRVFTAGRNITSICSGDQPGTNHQWDPRILDTMDRHFGSNVMVTTLSWKSCKYPEALLEYLIRKNPGVRHLTIEPVNPGTSETIECSQNPFFPPETPCACLKCCQEALDTYVHIFSLLPDLLTLEFHILVGVPAKAMLKWQQERCQSLRKLGNKALVSVSFNSHTTWRRHPDDERWRSYHLKTAMKSTEIM